MNILLLAQFYPPIIGGEERHVRNLAAALSQRGHRVSVATLWVPGTASFEMDGDVTVHRLKGTMQRLGGLFSESERRHAPPFPDPELMAALNRLVQQERPDIVHAHNWLLASFSPLKAWQDVGLLLTLHDYSLVCAKKNFMHNGVICDGPGLACLPCARDHYGTAKGVVTTLGNFGSRLLARHTVDRFIAVSHAVADYNGLKRYGVSHVVIPNFVPDNIAVLDPVPDPRLALLPQEPFIMFVGDLMRLKGIEVLVNAYATLEHAPPLVLIGRTLPETPKQMPPNVHVMGTWPHSAIMQAWSRCLFGVLPSTGPEACATVIMEAMAVGKPMIASDIGGMPDLVEPDIGMLVPPGDSIALANAMQSLLTAPSTLCRMGENCLVRVERLKATAVVSRIEAEYEAVLSERQQKRQAHG